MRLIDANKLGLHFNDWQLAEAPKDKTGHEPIEYTSHDMQSMIYRTIGDAMCGIDEAPTVEAIPIEWIEEWRKCLRGNIYNVSYENLNVLQERYEEYLKMERLLSMMIEDWRKENDTN